MNNSLVRSSILDHLAAHRGRGCSVHEIAEQCAIPAASCHRLLQSLLALGWVDQRQRRGGYLLGPRAWALTSGAAYREQLLSAAREPALGLAVALQRQVVIADLRGTHRQTLAEYMPGDRDGRVTPRESDDCYSTSGGRLLLAMLSRRERRPVIDQLGLPGAVWPGLLTVPELHDELDRISLAGVCFIAKTDTDTCSAVIPGSTPTAVLGTYGPRHHDERALRRAVKAAAQAAAG